MKVLLDTHAFIWWDSDPTKLSPQARATCEDRTNVVLLSVEEAVLVSHDPVFAHYPVKVLW